MLISKQAENIAVRFFSLRDRWTSNESKLVADSALFQKPEKGRNYESM